jgi:acetaldehyde dehydrogenase/alcohol dehydrogenase
MKKENVKSDEKFDKKLSVENEIDALVQNAEEALKTYVDFDQEQVDKIVYAMALAGLEHHRELARLAVDETHRGVYEDKIIKNIFATEYIWNSIKNERTVGVVEDNEMEGYVEVA